MELENYYKNAVSTRFWDKSIKTIPLIQSIVLFELKKAKDKPVLLKYIRNKYKIKGFTLSRNSEMLGVPTFMDRGKTRKGKGWITKKTIKDNKTMKEVRLTKKGKILVERLFEE